MEAAAKRASPLEPVSSVETTQGKYFMSASLPSLQSSLNSGFLHTQTIMAASGFFGEENLKHTHSVLWGTEWFALPWAAAG